MNYDLVINNGKVVSTQTIENINIGINGGKIETLSSTLLKGENEIDASGKLVFPGIIDTHVHFQLEGPGTQKTSDSFLDGTKAAIFGGVTSVIDFADQYPGANMSPLESVEKRLQQIHQKGSFVDFGLHLNLTDSRDQTLKEIPEVIALGVPSFKLFTIGREVGLYLSDHDLVRILSVIKNYPNAYAVIHAENDALFEYNLEKQLENNLTAPINHALSRPPEVEHEAVNRVIEMSRNLGCRIHLFHLSTFKSAKLVKMARDDGLPVTGETAPHYLEWTVDKYKENDGYLYLMSPPLRPKPNNELLWTALRNGWLQQIITDHCTYSLDQKGRGKLPFTKIAKGIDGVETLLPIIYDRAVNKRNYSPTRVVEWLSANPAKVHNLIDKKGTIEPGKDADIVIFDPKDEKTITSELLHGKDFTAWNGITVKGWPEKIIKSGKIVVDQGNLLVKQPFGQFLKR